MADEALIGSWACRFCRHDQHTHNLIQGCVSCWCAATPGEAAPRNNAELDAPILPAGQHLPKYEPPSQSAPRDDLRTAILAKLDGWANADDPGEVFDATERMNNALRAVVVGPDWGDFTPSYLPQPWANEAIAAALGITPSENPVHACPNCEGVDPASCLFSAKEANRG